MKTRRVSLARVIEHIDAHLVIETLRALFPMHGLREPRRLEAREGGEM